MATSGADSPTRDTPVASGPRRPVDARLTFMTAPSYRRILIGFLPLFALGLLMLPIAGTVTTVHTGIDLLNADRVLRGDVVQYVSRVTVFVLMAGAVLLFGRSVGTVVFVTRLFYVLGLWVVYALSTRLYGVVAGLIASALVVSSFGVNYVASFATSVDTIAPFIILLFVLALHSGLQSGKATLLGAAGVALAIGCLAKEVTLPLVALPLLTTATVREYRDRRRRWRLLGALYAALTVIYVPWLTYVWVRNGSPSALLGLGSPQIVGQVIGGAEGSGPTGYGALIDGLVWQLPRTAATYYRTYLGAYFNLAPLMVAAMAFVGVRAIRCRRGADVVLILSIVLYSPSVLVQALVGERLGQGMAFFYFGYIAIAELTVTVARWMSDLAGVRFARSIQYSVAGLAVAVMVALQGFGGAHPTYPLLADGTGPSTLGKLSFYRFSSLRYDGRFSNEVEAALHWVSANTPIGTPLLVDSTLQPPMRVFAGSAYPLYNFANMRATGEIRAQLERGEAGPRGRPLLALPLASFMSGPPRYRDWYLILEGELLADIAASPARHILLGPRRLFVSIYLDAVPWATRRFRNSDVAVYTIQSEAVAPIEHWRIVSSEQTRAILPAYRQQYPDEFRRFQEFLNRFQLNDQDLTSNTYSQYQRRWVMEHIDPKARITYTNPLGEFLVPEWNKHTSWFNKDRPFSSFSGQDYLFIHSLRRLDRNFVQLFSDLEHVTPLKSFPRLPAYDFGEGWDIYQIPAAIRGSSNKGGR